MNRCLYIITNTAFCLIAIILIVACLSPSVHANQVNDTNQLVEFNAPQAQSQPQRRLQSPDKTINIVVINAFNPVLPWSRSIVTGLGKGVFKQDVQVKLYVESLFVENINSEARLKQVIESFKVKYGNQNIDVLITDSINGFDFLNLLTQEPLFNSAHKLMFDAMQVHQSLNDLSAEGQNITSHTIEKQIASIFALSPETKRVVINQTRVNLFMPHFNELKRYIANNKLDTQIEVWQPIDFDDFVTKTNTLKQDDIFIYFPFFENESGRFLSPQDFIKNASPFIDVPIYTFWKPFLGSGVVGGYLYDPIKQGELMIDLAVAKVLGQKLPADASSAAWAFDEQLFERYQLTLDSINPNPDNITWVNQKRNIIEDYPLQIASVVVLMMLIIALVFYYKNRKLNQALALLSTLNVKMKQVANEAKASSQAKSDFLAMISHEIRTPINGIMGVLGLLNKEDLSPEQKDLVSVGAYSTESLLRTVNDILDFSKLESNKMELELAGFSPRQLLLEVYNYANVCSQKEAVTIEADLNKLVDVPLLGDKNRIKQVLINLVNNSIKFTEQGSVTIKASLSKTELHYQLDCYIEDTGIGISESDQKDLFVPFNQVQSHLSRTVSGTGLGLSICLKILQQMNGTINLTSEEGKGTHIHVSLPLQLAERVHIGSEHKLENDKISTKKLSVLLVEDNLINQEITVEQLKQANASCFVVENGAECISHLLDKKPLYDVILMDVQMPIMDGYTATQKIRSGEAGKQYCNIPIIALTAHVSLNERRFAHRAGMNSHVNKPVEPDKLISEIHALVS